VRPEFKPQYDPKKRNNLHSWAWWYISVIPTLGKLRQEDFEFEARMDPVPTKNLTHKDRRLDLELQILIVGLELSALTLSNPVPSPPSF
jgi:hypothetical protein